MRFRSGCSGSNSPSSKKMDAVTVHGRAPDRIGDGSSCGRGGEQIRRVGMLGAHVDAVAPAAGQLGEGLAADPDDDRRSGVGDGKARVAGIAIRRPQRVEQIERVLDRSVAIRHPP